MKKRSEVEISTTWKLEDMVPDNETWEKQLKEIGVSVVYLPYTNEVSSSKIIQKIAQMRQIH